MHNTSDAKVYDVQIMPFSVTTYLKKLDLGSIWAKIHRKLAKSPNRKIGGYKAFLKLKYLLNCFNEWYLVHDADYARYEFQNMTSPVFVDLKMLKLGQIKG